MNQHYERFKVGKVFNPVSLPDYPINIKLEEVTVEYPSRLNAMVLDDRRLLNNHGMKCTAGEILFSIGLYQTVNIKTLINKGEFVINQAAGRRSIVLHAAMIMKHAIGFKEGLEITVNSDLDLVHSGLGSSGSIISGIAVAINEIYGNPIPKNVLARYVSQNYGEEIKGQDGYLVPVQSIGGSAVAGMYHGGVFVVTGETCVIAGMDIGDEYTFVVGIPQNYIPRDANTAYAIELDYADGFANTGKSYSQVIAYRLLHECIPGMVERNLRPLSKLIDDYCFEMNGIQNCQFNYPEIVNAASRLRYLKKDGLADILGLSSVGPALFVLTKSPENAIIAFKSINFKPILLKPHNQTYQILKKKFLCNAVR